ncbi:hypothetical protein [Clostridium celatum]|uniref:hypothetical protein n=1 Tax=Clostridium celatum TaxID=36834 RepID=UPI0037429388
MSKPRHELKFFINLSDYYALKNRIKHIASLDKNANSNGIYNIRSLYWSYVNILDTKSQTFLCCTSS